MELFEWEDRYDLKVDSMNNEHKVLIKKMNHLHQINETDGSKAEIEAAFNNFATYTLEHFADEEKFMESVNYPGLTTHKMHHKNLIEKVVKFGDDFKNSDKKKFESNFFSFLTLWLSSHICGIDMKYAEHSNK